jgi:hypothetical protein
MSFFATKFLILRSSGNNKENGMAKVAAETGSEYLKKRQMPIKCQEGILNLV